MVYCGCLQPRKGKRRNCLCGPGLRSYSSLQHVSSCQRLAGPRTVSPLPQYSNHRSDSLWCFSDSVRRINHPPNPFRIALSYDLTPPKLSNLSRQSTRLHNRIEARYIEQPSLSGPLLQMNLRDSVPGEVAINPKPGIPDIKNGVFNRVLPNLYLQFCCEVEEAWEDGVGLRGVLLRAGRPNECCWKAGRKARD